MRPPSAPCATAAWQAQASPAPSSTSISVPPRWRCTRPTAAVFGIPFDAVDRVRFGYETLRDGGRLYDTRLWTHRARRPLLLRHAVRDTTDGYEAVARGLAAAVAARRGIGAVEGGIGGPWSLFYGLSALSFLTYGAWAALRPPGRVSLCGSFSSFR